MAAPNSDLPQRASASGGRSSPSSPFRRPPSPPGPLRPFFEYVKAHYAVLLPVAIVIVSSLFTTGSDPEAPTRIDGIGHVEHNGFFGPIVIRPWAALDRVPAASLRSVAFASDLDGVAVGDHGLALRTIDGGRHWSRAGVEGQPALNAVAFWNEANGMAVGDQGSVLRTTDGGETWQLGYLPMSIRNLLPSGNPAQSAPNQVALAGAAYGNADQSARRERFATQMRGETASLTAAPSGAFRNLDVALLSSGRALIATTDPSRPIWFSDDGGLGWAPLSLDSRLEAPARLAVGPDETVYAVDGESGGVFSNRPEDGAVWRVLNSGGAAQSGKGAGWRWRGIVATEGGVVLVGDGGCIGKVVSAEIELLTNAVDEDLLTVASGGKDASTLWAAGSKGALLQSTDLGASWKRMAFPYDTQFESVAALPDGTAVAAGADGAIVRLSNEAVSPLTRNALPDPKYQGDAGFVAMPAPWIWALALGLIGGALLKSKTRKQIVETRDRIAEQFVSDKPLELGDPDWLGFDLYVNGITNYLRNENTTAPLTLAICGEWGSGKSSMMNLIRRKLEQLDYKPVWFNAWHHRQEENILAFLLQTIKGEGIPPWHSQVGLAYRCRLVSSRLFSRPNLALLTIFLVCLGGSMGLSTDFRLFDLFNLTLSDISIEELFRTLEEKNVSLLEAFAVASTSGGAVLAPIVWLWRVFKSFGVNPATLIVDTVSKSDLKNLDARTRFRQKFTSEFREVTHALGSAPLVIFIDDLDRCDPSSVMQVLEATNYLVSSGDCYVVIGMDEARVKDCVAAATAYYDESPASESAPDSAAKVGDRSVGQSAAEKRRDFADRYLEKLIQIKVRVPKPSRASAAKLAANERLPPAGADRQGPIQAWVKLWRERRREVTVTGLAILLGVSGFAIGGRLGSEAQNWIAVPDTSEAQQSPAASAEVLPATGEVGEDEARSAAASELAPIDERIPPAQENLDTMAVRAAEVAPGGGSSLAWVGFLAALAGGGALLYKSVEQLDRRLIIRDSEAFLDSARKWSALLHHSGATPRYFKRFLNRVRFYAMLQKRDTDEENDAASGVAEELLVAFGAIEQTHPEWVDLDRTQLLEAVNRDQAPLADEIVAVIEAMRRQEVDTQFATVSESVEFK